MAVEAHHLHLFPSQLITNRDSSHLYTIDNQLATISSTQMGFGVPPATGTGCSSFIPFYNSCSTTNTADASDSGVTFYDLSSAVFAASKSRKRPRVPDHRQFSFLGEDLSLQIQQQQVEIDRLVTHHTEKVRLELWERRRQLSRRLVAAVEEGMLKRLKAKEEEMEKIGRLNCALEERFKSLCAENQIWRELAQTNETAANVLRTNLEQVLTQQAQDREEHQQQLMQRCDTAEDAESCCDNYQNNAGAGEEDTAATTGKLGGKRGMLVCRGCGKEEPSVLLLPCRHLCLCPRCSPAAQACPICRSHKQCTVHVNLS